jgi:hypothetical protein
MLLTAILTLSLFGQWPGAQARQRHVGPWRIEMSRDRFAGTLNCSIDARDVTFTRETLIFRVGGGVDTTHSLFRLDSGRPRPVADVFDLVQARGFFPQRGWILDPAGGEVALPAAYVADARRVTIRVSPGSRPRGFRVERLAEARRLAKAAGCLGL